MRKSGSDPDPFGKPGDVNGFLSCPFWVTENEESRRHLKESELLTRRDSRLSNEEGRLKSTWRILGREGDGFKWSLEGNGVVVE